MCLLVFFLTSVMSGSLASRVLVWVLYGADTFISSSCYLRYILYSPFSIIVPLSRSRLGKFTEISVFTSEFIISSLFVLCRLPKSSFVLIVKQPNEKL